MTVGPEWRVPEIEPWNIHGAGLYLPMGLRRLETDPDVTELIERISNLGIPAFMVRPDLRKTLPLLPYSLEEQRSLGFVSLDALSAHVEELSPSQDLVKRASSAVSQLHTIAVLRRAQWAVSEGEHAVRLTAAEVEGDMAYAERLRDSFEVRRSDFAPESYENPVLYTTRAGERVVYDATHEAVPLIDMDNLLRYFQSGVFRDSVSSNQKKRYAKGAGSTTIHVLTHFMNSRIRGALVRQTQQVD